MYVKLHQTDWGLGIRLKKYCDHIGLFKVAQFLADLFFKLGMGYVLFSAFVPIIAPRVEDYDGKVR